MKTKLHTIFSNHGILIENGEEDELLYLSSLTFISIVVQIENTFDICIPEEYININTLTTFSDFERVVEEQINELC